MTTKIKSLAIVCQTGVSQYIVGREYNGLLLDSIKDCTLEYPEAFHSIFQGMTSDNELVFEAIDAPVEVEYCKADEE